MIRSTIGLVSAALEDSDEAESIVFDIAWWFVLIYYGGCETLPTGMHSLLDPLSPSPLPSLTVSVFMNSIYIPFSLSISVCRFVFSLTLFISAFPLAALVLS